MTQIIAVEIKTAGNGNSYKQVTLAEKAYGKDRTNVFNNHPLYGLLEVGYDIPLDQLEINQKGYLELKGGIAKKAQPATQYNVSELAINTRMDQHFAALRADLKIIADFLGVEVKPTIGNTNLPYPTEPQGQPNFEKPVMPEYPEEINPEDIPF